jgi:hypothetical protein
VERAYVGSFGPAPGVACAAERNRNVAQGGLPAMTERSSVASLSKRTTDGTLSPVPGSGPSGAISGPLRGTDVMKATTRSGQRSLSREMTRAGRRLSPAGYYLGGATGLSCAER